MSSGYYSFFENGSCVAQLCVQIYESFISRNWITYAGEMAKHLRVDESYFVRNTLSKAEHYSELKKAFAIVLKALRDKVPGSIEDNGKKKGIAYRYVGAIDDPFADERSMSRKQTITDYIRFCKGTIGLLPPGWFSTFFDGTQILGETLKEEREGKLFIGATNEQILKNIDLLPLLYDYIDEEMSISFDYCQFGKQQEHIILHPQYLKEYNGRWFVLGVKEGSKRAVDVYALDRIVSHIEPSEVKYIPAPSGFFKSYFNDIVGVTHEPDGKIQHIVIKTRSSYIHGLMVTKPFHKSFSELSPYTSHEDDKYPYGLITYDLEPNREFIGKILTFGPDLEVVMPTSLREEIQIKVEHLAWRYGIRTKK